MDDALQWSREIAEVRKILVPKVLNMQKELLDLEFNQVIAAADHLVSSGSTKDDAPQDKPVELPEIKPWCPTVDVRQLLSEINNLRKMSSSFRTSGISASLKG